MAGQKLQAVFGLLAAGDIGKHAYIVRQPAVSCPHRADGQLGHVGVAAFMAVEHFAFPVPVALQRLDQRAVALAVGRAQHARYPANGFVRAKAGNAGKRLVHHDDAALGVGHQNALGGIVEYGGGQAQLGAGGHAVGNIHDHADNRLAALVVKQAAVHFYIHLLAILAQQTRGVVHVLDIVSNATADLRTDTLRLSRRQNLDNMAANQLVGTVLHQIGQLGVHIHQHFFLRDVNAHHGLLYHRAVLFHRLLAQTLFGSTLGNVYRNTAHARGQAFAIK